MKNKKFYRLGLSVSLLALYCTTAWSAERVVQFAGLVSSITERKETTEFLDKVLCNIVIVNTSQTNSNQAIIDVNFYNYGYTGTGYSSIRSARVQMSNTGDAEAARYNQMLIHGGSTAAGTSCIYNAGDNTTALEPLGTCVIQFTTNTIPAGSSTVGVCAGNVRVRDVDPAAPGFVVASGSASLIQEVKVLGGVLSGAHFLSGPAFSGAVGTAVVPLSTDAKSAVLGTSTPSADAIQTLPANMNLECRNSCMGVRAGVLQSISRRQNPHSNVNGGPTQGSVFDTVRNFCKTSASGTGGTPYLSGRNVYDLLWTNAATLPNLSSTRSDAFNLFTPAGSTNATYGNAGKTAIHNSCNPSSNLNLMTMLRECHYDFFAKECVQIADNIEKSFYQGGIGYHEYEIYAAFSREMEFLFDEMRRRSVFTNRCLNPGGLFNVYDSGNNILSPALTRNSSDPIRIAAYPASAASDPANACFQSMYNGTPDTAIGYLSNYISEEIVPRALVGQQSPFEYTRSPGSSTTLFIPGSGGTTDNPMICDAICGGAAAYRSPDFIHEPNLGMEAGILNSGRPREYGQSGNGTNKVTFGGLAQKITPPEFKGGLVKEFMIGGFGTICSANEGFTDWNNIKDASAFTAQSINGQYRYCSNRLQGGADDLLFGVQGVISYPVNGGSPF